MTVWDRPAGSGGPENTFRLLSSAATANANSVKAGPGSVFHVSGQNTSGATKHLKLYDTATAPTAGSGTPKRTVAIPPGSFVLEWVMGYYFPTGIGFTITGLGPDADTTALAAGDIVDLNIDYA